MGSCLTYFNQKAMKDIDLTTPLAPKIISTLHDILCFTEGSDIVLIGDIASWTNSLPDEDVFHDIKYWIETISESKNQSNILERVKTIEFDAQFPNQSILQLVIIVFDLPYSVL